MLGIGCGAAVRILLRHLAAPCLAAVFACAAGCKSSPSKPTIEAETQETASVARCKTTKRPKSISDRRPPDGPFYERDPPEGPPRTTDLRPEARVPPAEFFTKYGKDMCLGPKDEMRFERVSEDSYPFVGVDGHWYAQLHDGYIVQGGSVQLVVRKDGLVHGTLHPVIPDLPDAPEVKLTKERAGEIAIAEVARKSRTEPAGLIVGEARPVWAWRRGPSEPPEDRRLVFRCQVVRVGAPGYYQVDLDVQTGELLLVDSHGNPGHRGPPEEAP